MLARNFVARRICIAAGTRLRPHLSSVLISTGVHRGYCASSSCMNDPFLAMPPPPTPARQASSGTSATVESDRQALRLAYRLRLDRSVAINEVVAAGGVGETTVSAGVRPAEESKAEILAVIAKWPKHFSLESSIEASADPRQGSSGIKLVVASSVHALPFPELTTMSSVDQHIAFCRELKDKKRELRLLRQQAMLCDPGSTLLWTPVLKQCIYDSLPLTEYIEEQPMLEIADACGVRVSGTKFSKIARDERFFNVIGYNTGKGFATLYGRAGLPVPKRYRERLMDYHTLSVDDVSIILLDEVPRSYLDGIEYFSCSMLLSRVPSGLRKRVRALGGIAKATAGVFEVVSVNGEVRARVLRPPSGGAI